MTSCKLVHQRRTDDSPRHPSIPTETPLWGCSGKPQPLPEDFPLTPLVSYIAKPIRPSWPISVLLSIQTPVQHESRYLLFTPGNVQFFFKSKFCIWLRHKVKLADDTTTGHLLTSSTTIRTDIQVIISERESAAKKRVTDISSFKQRITNHFISLTCQLNILQT